MSTQNNALSNGIVAALVGCGILAAVSTFGDWLWSRYIPDGAVLPGVIHGAVIFLVLALVLGKAAGTPTAMRRLLPTLPVAGIVIAAIFYPIAYAIGYIGALLVTWVMMWLSTAGLQRWARDGDESVGLTLLRGVAAAIGSGLAFWAISGIWTQPSPTVNYLWRFLNWAFAFLPGFLALLWRPRRG
ncbi:MAG: hypothetical protein AAF560_30950 [Acidobacteriota bacterium]